MKALQAISMKDVFPVIWLTVVVAIAVSALTITDMVTRDLIEEAREAEIKEMLEELYPGMDDFEKEEDIYFILVRNADNVTVSNDYGIDENNTIIGFAFLVEGDGYGGTIEMILGIDNSTVDPTLVGLKVLFHSETPGLGAKINEDDFTSQFEGITQEEARLTDDGGKVDAISGATISSKAVIDAVQDAIDEALGKLEDMTEVSP